MRTMVKVTVICFALLSCAFCDEMADHDEDHHDDEEHPSSHRQYHRDLSDRDHHADDPDKHDSRYDHEAFLGKDESAKFDQLSPEESKQRLSVIVGRIDTDRNGKIDEGELQKWINGVGLDRITKDSARHFNDLEPENNKLSWERYEERFYLKPDPNDEERKFEDSKDTLEKIEKDKKKWKLADQDGDGLLSQAEYVNFLHPEEAPHMRDYVIEEALMDLDDDKDGRLNVEEFLKSYWTPSKEEPTEPSWVQNERESFKQYDRNGNGKLEPEEIGEWIVPQDFDSSASETKHLIQEADSDGDGVLTKDEILKKHELFAGSQATDYGSALSHEEL